VSARTHVGVPLTRATPAEELHVLVTSDVPLFLKTLYVGVVLSALVDADQVTVTFPVDGL
jgi:hypothetical protein